MNPERLPELSSDLKSLAANLAALVPAAGNLQRDELMYRAGWEACAAAAGSADATARAQAPRARQLAWLWPMCTAGLVLVAATLGIALATRAPEVQVVYIERPGRLSAESQEAKPPSVVSIDSSHDAPATVSSTWLADPEFHRTQLRPGHEYLSLRQRVLAFGVDVLQSGAVSPSSDDIPSVSDSRYGALIGQLRGG
jgi:hypothetical protein